MWSSEEYTTCLFAWVLSHAMSTLFGIGSYLLSANASVSHENLQQQSILLNPHWKLDCCLMTLGSRGVRSLPKHDPCRHCQCTKAWDIVLQFFDGHGPCWRNVVHHNYLFSKGVVKVTEDPGFWKDAPDQLGALKKTQNGKQRLQRAICIETNRQTHVFFVHLL